MDAEQPGQGAGGLLPAGPATLADHRSDDADLANVQYPYDLFISCADGGEDQKWVEAHLIRAIGLAGDRVITHADFRPGAALAEEFERAISQSRYTVLVLTPAYFAGRWTMFGERLVTWTAVESGAARLIPLVREAVELPPRLSYQVRLDCTQQDQWEAEARRLRKLLDQPDPLPEAEIECPYPGMVAFERKDEGRFFGREKLVGQLVERLCAQSYIALIGPSGGGKSSLINAGLLPALERDRRFGSGQLHVIRFRPGPAPIVNMASEIAREQAEDPGRLAADLDRANGSVAPALEQITTPDAASHGLLIVDQLEEAFAQCKDAALRTRFFALLERLLRDVPERWLVVLAIRADFYGELMHLPLWGLLEVAQVPIPPMAEPDLRRAIELPAQQVHAYLEARLVDRLIDDARDEKGALPLIQQTLVVMWDRFLNRRLLTLADYESLGSDGRTGLQEALRIWADGTLTKLQGPDQQEIARRIFMRLIEFGADRKDTRRQQSREDLLSAGASDAEVTSVLETLVQRRLVTADRDVATGEARVDLAHETLIEAWPCLHDWVVTYEAMESMRRQLVMSATEWREHGRGTSYAFTGARLRDVERWAASWPQEVGPHEAEFIAASKRVDRRQKILGGVLGGGLALFVVAVGIFVGHRELVRLGTGSPTVMLGQASSPVAAGSPSGAGQPVDVPAFRIETHEVSNRQYRACVDTGGCTPPIDRSAFATADGADLPVVAITPTQAEAYCGWLHRRLPTAAEWEHAGRGPSDRPWPWGNASPDGFDSLGRLSAVGTTDATKSPEGVYDLVGNVAEWVVVTAPDVFAAAGGAYDRPITELTEMSNSLAANWDPSTGFRCAATAT